jgi:hypothetical protein
MMWEPCDSKKPASPLAYMLYEVGYCNAPQDDLNTAYIFLWGTWARI